MREGAAVRHYFATRSLFQGRLRNALARFRPILYQNGMTSAPISLRLLLCLGLSRPWATV
jgi:hypothetical protein